MSTPDQLGSATGPLRPLWAQLQAAAGLLQAVQGGASTTQALARVPAIDRAAAQALGFHALRRLGMAAALRALLAPRRPDPAVDALLCLVLALAVEDEGRPMYPSHTLLSQGVEAAKRSRALRAQAGFLNACWRRYLRDRQALHQQLLANEAACLNHPQWWVDAVRADHPSDWSAILAANLRAAPMSLRVNRRALSRDDYLVCLQNHGIRAWPGGEDGVVLDRACAVEALPGFSEGWVSVQDLAAQLAAPLIERGLGGVAPSIELGRPRWRILDACAAPGGKTAHLLERLEADVLALDIDPQRCERIGHSLRRLGLSSEVRAADASQPSEWWDGEAFDAVLLDAPCTASGIVRRHPDVLWLRRATDIAQLAKRQAQMLAALWPLVRPGGVMLYATCSVFRAEGSQQVAAFRAHHTEAALLDAPGHLLPTHAAPEAALADNAPRDHDGFFYALLRKPAGAKASPVRG